MNLIYKTKCNWLLIAFGLVIGGRVCAQGDDSAVLRQLIIDHFDGVAQKDFVKLRSVVTDDYVIYEDGKKWNADSVFCNIQYHQPFSVKFTLTDFRIFADTRSGNASYLSQADFVMRDTVHFTLHFIETATFRKTAEGWRIAMIHVTDQEPPVVDMPAIYRKYDTVRYIADHYRERVTKFNREMVRPGGTIFLGNSITEFGDWKRLLGDSNAINRGIAGDNTFGILDRLREVMALHPSKLVIEAGINDIGQGVPVGMIAGNIMSIVNWVRVKCPGTRIYVMSVLPTNDHAREDYPEVAGKNVIARELDGRLQEGARKYGYIYIDLASRLMDAMGNLDTRYAQPDGLHLNGEGYAILVRLLKNKGN